MTELMSVQNLSFSYSRDDQQPLFSHVSFSLETGNVFCLLGPNGTGKSTLLKCISNLLPGWYGTVLLDNRDITQLHPAETARWIGYVPQNQTPAFPFLVQDVVIMGRAPHLNIFSSPAKVDREIARQAMASVGILHLAERPCTMLSGGEWQLTLIARALAQEPRLLILDEPTSHLDLGNQVRILRVVKSLAEQDMGIIMATHFPDHAFIAATEVAVMHQGRMALKGPPDEVITNRNMAEAYGVAVQVIQLHEGIERKACFAVL
jgi:iron complex transport system ATP-binding protein